MMLKKPASFVLASFRPSGVPQRVRGGPELAAALLDGRFEYPAKFRSLTGTTRLALFPPPTVSPYDPMMHWLRSCHLATG